MEVVGPDICKYGVIIPGGEPNTVAGLIEKPELGKAPSNYASIGRYVLTLIFLIFCVPYLLELEEKFSWRTQLILRQEIMRLKPLCWMEIVLIVEVFKVIWRL